LKQGGAAAYKKALEEDLPLSPDNFTDSKITKWSTKVMDEVPPFSWGMQKKRADLINKITQAREDIITKHLGLPDPSTMTELAGLKNEAYEKAAELAGGKGAVVTAPAIKKFLAENIETPAVFDSKTVPSAVKDALTQLHKRISAGKDVTVADLNNLWAKKSGGGAFTKMSGEQKGFVGATCAGAIAGATAGIAVF